MSVKWRIFVFLLGFCAALLLLLWLFQVVFLGSFYKSIKQAELNSSAANIVRQIDSENLSAVVESVSQSNDVCIDILTVDGLALYSSDILRTCVIHKLPPEEKIKWFEKTLRAGGELTEHFFGDRFREPKPGMEIPDAQAVKPPPPPSREAEETIVYSRVVTDQTGQQLLVLINSVISPVSATVTTLRVQLYYITGFMLVFAVLIALVISKRVSQPIERITGSAKILATGEYDTEFQASGYREINELSDTLNYMAKELSKVEGLRRELIANVSHDFRTPLTLIAGYAEAMRDLDDENNPENAQIIIDEARRLTTLVNDVLDISKLQAGAQALQPKTFNLTASVRNLVCRQSELVRKEGYQIRFEYDQEIEVQADEIRISQALYNLLTNAITHTGADKLVKVRQQVTDQCVRLEVIDSGAGVAPEDLPYIWDRYYKVDEIHKRAITGTGLGLSIVKAIISQHGGRYGVDSQPGKGSTFWFALKRELPD